MTSTDGVFSGGTAGLVQARPVELRELAAGDRLTLSVEPVVKLVGEAPVKMLAYNRSVPGPTLKVPQGSEIVVDVSNQADIETTVHCSQGNGRLWTGMDALST